MSLIFILNIGIIPSWCRVSTNIRLHHFNFKDRLKKKQDRIYTLGCIMFFFKQVPDAIPYKTVAVRTLTFHLANHPGKSRHAWKCSRNMDKLKSNIFK